MENIENKIKTTPRDFFVFIGSMATLYASAVSLLNLLFEIINASFPDALSYSYDSFSSGMRWSIATLVIVFPLYIFLSWFINKDLTANPLKRNIWVRRWFTYLTLFVAGVAIITDLIMLINTFLGGEITARFAFKVLAVFIVAGLAFAYYLYDLKREVGQKTGKIKLVAWVVSFGVLASIVGGFFIMGSPAVLRMKKFDERRVGDLQNIQYQIVNFYQRKGDLPTNIEDVKDPLSGFGNIPNDPETNVSYDYKKIGKLEFELCAIFGLDNNNNNNSNVSGKNAISKPVRYDTFGVFVNENWQHKAGKQCFERKIDPELYPILKEGKI
ncbi:MAG: DUF5671 domain-containing protein [Patescibacteria group bacterium]